MRFILGIAVIVVLIVVGLFVYGGMIEPDVSTIEQEATGVQL